MRKERIAYPAFIKECGSEYLVYIPDIDAYTEGSSFTDAIVMARDIIGSKAMDWLDDGKDFPKVSSPSEALEKAKLDADEDFDYSDGVMTYVDVDVVTYRNRVRNRAVKKNCTIPYWLNEEAESMGINFSKTLQEALIQRLESL